MKILVIAERLPSLLGGGLARPFNLIRALSQKHQYTIAAHAFSQDLIYRDLLSSFVERLELVDLALPEPQAHSAFYWQRTAWQHAIFDPFPTRGRYFITEALQKKITNLLVEEVFDVIQVQQAYLLPLLPERTPPVIVDMQDILSDFERQAVLTQRKASHRLQAWLEWQKMKALERRALHRANVFLAVSADDRDLWVHLHSKVATSANRVVVVPNGVDIDYFYPGPEGDQGDRLFFSGSLNYQPNSEAVRWFHREIFPLIQAAREGVSWQIAGWGPPADIQALNDPPTIEVTGFVEDIRPYFSNSSVVVVPLRKASGTRLKILDAWAMGKAVVSTRLGAQGLHTLDQQNILLADNPQEFAACVLRLLANPAERQRLGQAGRQTVETHYSWNNTAQELDAAYHSLA